jgi:hypothetical protein
MGNKLCIVLTHCLGKAQPLRNFSGRGILSSNDTSSGLLYEDLLDHTSRVCFGEDEGVRKKQKEGTTNREGMHAVYDEDGERRPVPGSSPPSPHTLVAPVRATPPHAVTYPPATGLYTVVVAVAVSRRTYLHCIVVDCCAALFAQIVNVVAPMHTVLMAARSAVPLRRRRCSGLQVSARYAVRSSRDAIGVEDLARVT